MVSILNRALHVRPAHTFTACCSCNPQAIEMAIFGIQKGFVCQICSTRLWLQPLLQNKGSESVVVKVQGVFFRDSTTQEAKRLGVVGWVANTSAGTVKGEVQGKRNAAEEMKVHLSKLNGYV